MVTTPPRWPRWFSWTLAVALACAAFPVLIWAGHIWFDGILGGAAAALLTLPISLVLGVLAVRRIGPDPVERNGADLAFATLLTAYGVVLYLDGPSDLLFLLNGVLLPALVWVWLWGSYGWSFASAMSFPVAFSLFALPWEYFLRDSLEVHLQIWTTDIAFFFLDFVGYKVWYHNPYTIDSDPFYLVVNETCSGINMLVALGMYTLIFAWLVQPRFSGRLALLTLVFPLAMMANGLRVLTIFLLGYYGGLEWADGFWHTGSAYIIFLPVFWFVFVVNQALNRVFARKLSSPAAPE